MIRRIACLGWYNKQNLGDELLREAITKLLQNHEVVFFGFMPPATILNQFDYVIVGGGSIYPKHPFFENYLSLRRKIKVPFSVIGISAKTKAQDKVTNAIIHDARLFIVRDQLSFTWLQSNSKIKVAPDLSWLSPLPFIQNVPDKMVIGLNLRDGQDVTLDSKRKIVEVLNHVTDKNVPISFFSGAYVWEKTIRDQDVMDLLGVVMSQNDSALLNYSKVRIVVGMRFHAIVLAAQAGIPFITFDYHPKTFAFCQDIQLEKYCISINDTDKLGEMIKELESEYEQIRHHLYLRRQENIDKANQIYGEVQRDINSLPDHNKKMLIKRIKARIKRAF